MRKVKIPHILALREQLCAENSALMWDDKTTDKLKYFKDEARRNR